MRLRKLLEQKDFGRIKGVPAVARRAIARSATADPSRFFQRPAVQQVVPLRGNLGEKYHDNRGVLDEPYHDC